MDELSVYSLSITPFFLMVYKLEYKSKNKSSAGFLMHTAR